MASTGGSASPPRGSPRCVWRGSPTRGPAGAADFPISARLTPSHRAAPDPGLPPRILRHGGCSAFPASPSIELAPLLLGLASESPEPLSDQEAGELPSPFNLDGTQPPPAPRMKSIVVAPSPGCRLSSSGAEHGWTEVTSRRGRACADLLRRRMPPSGHQILQSWYVAAPLYLIHDALPVPQQTPPISGVPRSNPLHHL
ncbi:hypothetical protein ZWY2020_048356 [Hordeum vulgare]|nr:hypothetical protein ZWY2020_048356 [Hordeum vulgare]